MVVATPVADVMMTHEGKQRMVMPAPAELQYKGMRFLITHNPSSNGMDDFVSTLKQHKADTVVRVCESTYDKKNLTNEGFEFMDWVYDDGAPPPIEIVQCWLELLKNHAKQHPDNSIAIHCVAGLGRAPVLVALALIENGMNYEQAVGLIRQKRRGAINSKQMKYLESYKPTNAGKVKHHHHLSTSGPDKKQCCIQ